MYFCAIPADQSEAIKTIKRKITDLDKMKIEEQKKAVRSGYDMDIIPSDLATFGSEAKNLLQDLQSRNERMFLLTFLVVNMADTKRKLENDIFAAAGKPVWGFELLAVAEYHVIRKGVQAIVQGLPRLKKLLRDKGNENSGAARCQTSLNRDKVFPNRHTG